jgi:hypothetical protein
MPTPVDEPLRAREPIRHFENRIADSDGQRISEPARGRGLS